MRQLSKSVGGTLSVLSLLFLLGCDKGATGTTDGGPTMAQLKAMVCQPFDSSSPGSSSLSSDLGIVADLYSFEHKEPSFSCQSVNDDDDADKISVELYLSDISISTRPGKPFVNGLGEQVKRHDGNILQDHYALEMKSSIGLSADDAPGDYQFAMISNGAELSLSDSSGQPVSTLIDNYHDGNRWGDHHDDDHSEFNASAKMSCASSPVSFEQNTRMPFNLRDYVGESENATLVLMWRPWPKNPSQVMDSECSRSQRSRYFNFDYDHGNSKPSQEFSNLAARGWKVLTPANYYLLSGTQNPCASDPGVSPAPTPTPAPVVPAPVIPDASIIISAVTNASAEIGWTTDAVSTSQVTYTNLITGVVVSTPVDNTLVTAHSVTLTGLSPLTLYTAVVISASSSGQSTSGTTVSFRTLQ